MRSGRSKSYTSTAIGAVARYPSARMRISPRYTPAGTPRGTLTRTQKGWFTPASRSSASRTGGRGSGHRPTAPVGSVGRVTGTYATRSTSTASAGILAPPGPFRSRGSSRTWRRSRTGRSTS